ncbi:MAG: hypothetical protein LKI24_05665 [Acidipropionibacterium sp.]|nr:hypothetical protein [Acidipropionibacterium sp.]
MGNPATSFSSLMAIGTPWSGPSDSPRALTASRSFASARAASAMTAENALSCGSSRWMRASVCSTSSREDTSPEATHPL